MWVDWGVDDAPDLEQVKDGLEITHFLLQVQPWSNTGVSHGHVLHLYIKLNFS